MTSLNIDYGEKFSNVKQGIYFVMDLSYILTDEEYDFIENANKITTDKIAKIEIDKAGQCIYAMKTAYGAGEFPLKEGGKKIKKTIHVDYDYFCLIPKGKIYIKIIIKKYRCDGITY